MTDETLAKSILKTIAYFHLFKIPLTDREIHKNLFSPEEPADLADVQRVLKNKMDKTLSETEGFYYFRGADGFIQIRKEHYLISDEKIKKSLLFIRIISRIPFVRGVFICNNLACQNANNGSDIDLAIVCADNRIWLSRFLAVIFMKILAKRPNKETTKDKICLSFFMCESSLDLQRLAYPEDIHFIYWINQFMPIYDPHDIAKQFEEANRWTKEFLPNHFRADTCRRWRIADHSVFKLPLESLLKSRFGVLLENWLKRLQIRIMPERLKRLAAENNTDVVLQDDLLKFHDKDKRGYYRERWKNLISRA